MDYSKDILQVESLVHTLRSVGNLYLILCLLPLPHPLIIGISIVTNVN